jgi:coproporphyrinogen III oxidase
VTDTSPEARIAAAAQWFGELRDAFCAAFEAIEDEYAGPAPGAPGRFVRTAWTRPVGEHEAAAADGGGGTMAVMKGRVFEKVGVNFSRVHGQFAPAMAKEIPGTEQSARYRATGISLVAHMANPRVPAMHFNTRHLATGKSWFGGGGDLTPMLAAQRTVDHPNTRAFHEALKRACDAHGADYYDRFKKWCDEYFFIKHRNEARGMGGIFYDYLDSGDWDADFAFTRDVGRALLEVFPRLVRGAMNEVWTNEEREEQLVRRGRYAEFNLVYDRGTKFGLATGGNIEAILMSLPPLVRWP